MKEIWELVLRSRITGECLETIYKGDHDKAFSLMRDWYDKRPEFWKIVPREDIGTATVNRFIDGSNGVFADCYLVDERKEEKVKGKKTYIVKDENTGFSTAIKLSDEEAKAIQWFIEWSGDLDDDYLIELAENYATEIRC